MHMPTDVAVDRGGRVFVVDGANDRILRFSPDGALELTFSGGRDQSLRQPVGLTVGPDDRLWIADSGNHRIVLLSSDGDWVETMNLAAAPGDRPVDPTDLVVTEDGRHTYIVDNDNHRLLIRDNQTGRLTTSGQQGSAHGQFQWPFMICRGAEGDLFVSESVGARVQRMSRAGEWIGQVGRWGVELGHLYRPKGVAADSRGRLFVSDSSLGVIQVFDPRGGVEAVLTDEKGTPLSFRHPMGLCFDASGRLYVVELAADRVAVLVLADRREGRLPESQPGGPRP